MQHFTSVNDVPSLHDWITDALEIQADPLKYAQLGTGKTLGLIFFNPSLRTRLSSQKAGFNLGMNVIVMNISEEGWKLEFEDGTVMNQNKAEHIKDAAAVMGRYCDIIGIRAFATLKDKERDYAEQVLSAFQQYAGVPIVSLESATRHPLQSFADVITIENHKQVPKPKVVLSWAPHPKALPQAVANSFCEWMQASEVEFVITHPEGYELAAEFVKDSPVEYEQQKALEGADFVYVKNWSAYNEYGSVLRTDLEWTLTADKMKLTNNGKFMHCLPVRRNVVVADDVIDSPNSLVLDQAANRVVSAQTVLKKILST